jgi:hypothetical protein
MSQANFQRIEGYNFVAVDKSVDDLWGCNYIMFQNASYNNKWFYAFVTKLEYKQRNTTYVHFEIDVFQTWYLSANLKPSFVVREHCPLWNSDGSPVINTVDEGLNYGTEYNIAKVQQYRPYDDLYFLVVITKKAIHDGDSKDKYVYSVNGMPQSLCFYVFPFRLDGSVPASNFTLDLQVGDFIVQCYSTTDAVNNIVSMYITDMLPDQPSYDGTTINFNINYYQQGNVGTASCVYVHNIEYSTGVYDMGSKYDGFTPVGESKLWMYPYTVTIMDDFKGNRIELKNEYIQNTNLMIDVKGSLGLSNKVVYSIKDYLTSMITDDTVKDMVSMEKALIDQNPNDIPVLVDSLAAYIQGNRNSIQNQKNQLFFNGVMTGINGAVNTAMGSMMMGEAGAIQGVGQVVQGLGNNLFQQQAINAKQQDISNVPPSIAKMGSNSYFDYGNRYTGIWVIKKEITPEYRKKLSDFFNMFGYKKNEVKLPNLHTRANWNYIQTNSCIITGNFNNEDLQALKNIYDAGITLWHTDDVGNYGLSNEVIA